MDNKSNSIPIVDLSKFTEAETVVERQAAADVIARAVHTHGCAGVVGHGLSSASLKQAFAIVKRLYELPLEDKMKAPHPPTARPHRGYSGVGRENASLRAAYEAKDPEQSKELRNLSDFKETYEIGSETNEEQKNIWLPDNVLPGFRSFMSEFFWQLSEVTVRILDALLWGLKVSDHERAAVFELHPGKFNSLRLSHYPPLTPEILQNPQMTRIAPHKDWSTFTILLQDGQGGLEFQNRETGVFMPALPQEGMLYLNTADMMEHLSNGYYPSCTHRVSFPKVSALPANTSNSDEALKSRYSIPYFLNPKFQGTIVPLPSCVRADGKELYEPTSLQEHSSALAKATREFFKQVD